MQKPAILKLPASLRDTDAQLSFAADPRSMLPGHGLWLLVNGERAFPAMLEAIERATRYVHLETYILEDDAIGDAFARVLEGRARAGVTVRVMYDALGSIALGRAYVQRLRDAGIAVVSYGPLGRRRDKGRWSRRDHRKILVVDGVVGFVGGINIGLDYAPRSIGGGGWRDTHVRIEGPVVAELEGQFRGVWQRAGGDPYPAYPADASESVAVPGSAWVRAEVADNRGRRGAIRRDYLHAIGRASSRVWIANAYFVPDRGVLRALTRAARRGVDVRVVLSGNSDIKLVQLAGEHVYARLLKRGVRLFQWTPSHLHAKTAVIDGTWSTIGSYNLDYISLFHNLEIVVEAIGREFGATMEAMFEADFQQCCELELERWRRRGPWSRLLSWLAYRARRWL